jgi:hypothetical protein
MILEPSGAFQLCDATTGVRLSAGHATLRRGALRATPACGHVAAKIRLHIHAKAKDPFHARIAQAAISCSGMALTARRTF